MCSGDLPQTVGGRVTGGWWFHPDLVNRFHGQFSPAMMISGAGPLQVPQLTTTDVLGE